MPNYPRDWDVSDLRCELILHLLDDGATTIEQLFTWPLPDLIRYLKSRLVLELTHVHRDGSYIEPQYAQYIIDAMDLFLRGLNPTSLSALELLSEDPAGYTNIYDLTEVTRRYGLFLPFGHIAAGDRNMVRRFVEGSFPYSERALFINIEKMNGAGGTDRVDLKDLTIRDLFDRCRLRDQTDLGRRYLKEFRDLHVFKIHPTTRPISSPLIETSPGSGGNLRCCSGGTCIADPAHPGHYCQSVDPSANPDSPCNAMSDAC